MTAILRALAAVLLLLPSVAAAQTYPSQSETAVTDDAEMLDPVAEAELAARLTALAQENNADLAVVTLPTTAFYTAGEDLDVYARGLMEDWSLGDTTGGRSVLVLVFLEDRELRIELGTGFDGQLATTAAAIVTDTLTPAFREENYAAGLTDAVDAIGQQILVGAEAEPVTAPETAPETTPEAAPVSDPVTPAEAGEEGGSGILLWLGGGAAALIALAVGANRRAAAKLAATPCPNCGKTGLTRERVTLQQATEKHAGHGEVRTTCPHCGHVEAEPFTLSKREPRTTDKDGAGRPVVHGTTKGAAPKGKGGGASGEW